MNSFGRLMRLTIFGESHGEAVGVVIEGCPAGLSLTEEDFFADLSRRQSGLEGTTARREPDIPILKSGLFKKKTTGAPLMILFENKDVKSEDWNDWHWQLANGIRDIKTLSQIIHLEKEDKDHLAQCLEHFRMAITPYYAALMDKQYRLCSVRLHAVPSIKELHSDGDDI